MNISVGVSNHHIHLSEEDYKILFNEDKMESVKSLVQTGEFASNLLVDIKTDKDIIKKVRVLGPLRSYTQVELSKTDSYKLGINPPIRNSGELIEASSVTIVGPYNEITKECAIIANRHIHLTSEDRKNLNLEGKDEVNVLIKGEKGGVFHHVKLKEDESYVLEMHIDTDDANAFLVHTNDSVEII